MRVELGYLVGIFGSPASRNSSGSAVIQGSQRLARILPIVVAANVLEPAVFSALAVALALTDLLRGALLALDVSAIRLLAPGTQREELLATHLLAKVIMGTVGVVLVVAVAILAFGMATAEIVVIASVGLVPAGMASLFLVRRQVDLRLGSATPWVVLASVVTAGVAMLAVTVTHDARWFAASLAAGDVVLFVLLFRDLPLHGWSMGPSVRLLQRAPALIAMQIAYIGQFRVGVLVLGVAGTAVAVGEYTVATRVAEGMVIIAAALTATSYPLMAAALGRGDVAHAGRILDRAYAIAVFIATLLVASLSLLAPLWLGIVFPRYTGASPSFALVGAAIVVFFGSSQSTAFLNAAHRDRSATLSSLLGLAAAVASTVLLAPLGAIGVAAARIVGEGVRQVIELGAIVAARPETIVPVAVVWLAAAPVIAVGVIGGLDEWHTVWTAVAVAGGLVATGAVVVLARSRIGAVLRG